MDDDLQNKILAYVTEPKACVCCRAWKDVLYNSLHLKLRIRFKQDVAEGSTIFSYNAVRPLGEDFEESVSYNFEFYAEGTYKMQWTRTFDAWTSQSEQHFGKWSVDKQSILCETLEPNRVVSEKEVRFAPPGYEFSIDIEDILGSQGIYFQEKVGAPAKPWESIARAGKPSDTSAVWTPGMWQPEDTSPQSNEPLRAPLRADARFVEIDGEMHEVSGDIVASRPEHEWAQLMRCRLRFGING
jgi:hypothetical protein